MDAAAMHIHGVALVSVKTRPENPAASTRRALGNLGPRRRTGYDVDFHPCLDLSLAFMQAFEPSFVSPAGRDGATMMKWCSGKLRGAFKRVAK